MVRVTRAAMISLRRSMKTPRHDKSAGENAYSTTKKGRPWRTALTYRRSAGKNGMKTGLLEVVIRRQRLLNVPPPHHDKRQAIGQAPFLVGAIGEQTECARAQLVAAGNHLNSRIEADSFVSVRSHPARSGARHRVQPLPTNGLGGDQKRSGPNKIVLPRASFAMVLVAVPEQSNPEGGVGEKSRRQNQPRLGVP